MASNFHPELINKDIVYCLVSQCPRAATCLRYLVYQHSAPFYTHSFVDPRQALSDAECPHYLSNRVQHIARGFKRGMGQLRYRSVRGFQARMRYELECGRSHFYRYSTGEYPLYEEKQTLVREVFREFGVEGEDLFDTFEDAYELPY